jgi:hypothetical protein
VPPSLAEITTVTAQQATEMAKPLKQQEVKKGRVWALFVLGATALFGSTGWCSENYRLLYYDGMFVVTEFAASLSLMPRSPVIH